MTDFLESASFDLPSQVKHDMAGRLKDVKGVKSVELCLKGDALEGAKEFGRLLLGMKRRGVKISHEFSIKLDFPRAVSRDKVLELVESMPRSKNGTVKVRIYAVGSKPASKSVKA